MNTSSELNISKERPIKINSHFSTSNKEQQLQMLEEYHMHSSHGSINIM
jgi:hypothetical protein